MESDSALATTTLVMRAGVLYTRTIFWDGSENWAPADQPEKHYLNPVDPAPTTPGVQWPAILEGRLKTRSDPWWAAWGGLFKDFQPLSGQRHKRAIPGSP